MLPRSLPWTAARRCHRLFGPASMSPVGVLKGCSQAGSSVFWAFSSTVFVGMETTRSPRGGSARIRTNSSPRFLRWGLPGRERPQRATVTAEVALTASANTTTMTGNESAMVAGGSIWEISAYTSKHHTHHNPYMSLPTESDNRSINNELAGVLSLRGRSV